MTTFYGNEIHIQRLLKRKKDRVYDLLYTHIFTLTHIVCLHMYVHKFSYIVMILYKPLI